MSRAAEFRKEVEALQKELGFEGAYQVFRVKLLDQYAKGQLSDESLVELQRQMSDLFGPALNSMVDQVTKDYDEIVDLVNTHYQDLGVDINRDFQEIQALERLNQAKWGQYEDETVQALARAARNSIINSESKEELSRRLQGIMPEDPDIDGKAVVYADTLAQSMIKGHGQAMKNEKSAIAEVFFQTYVGPPVRTKGLNISHVFCIELFRYKARTFHMNDIRKMKNGQLEPVEIHRGGYRCRHDWEPDPFYNGKNYSVSFITVMDGKRDVVVARHGSSTGPGLVMVDLQDIPRDFQETIIHEIDDLSQKYDTKLLELNASKESKNAYAGTSRDGRRIEFNRGYLKDREYFHKEFGDDVKSGFHAKVRENDYMRYIATHEFAHTIRIVPKKRRNEFDIELLSIRDRYRIDIKDPDKQKNIFISKYAEHNINEFMAEGFSMARLSKNPSPYALEIEVLIEKYYKKGDV